MCIRENNLNVTTHIQFSNATCEMIIAELEDPSILIIVDYRPPNCSIENFNSMISKANKKNSSKFTMPNIDWKNVYFSNIQLNPLSRFSDDLFIEQQITKTHKKKIYLRFSILFRCHNINYGNWRYEYIGTYIWTYILTYG